MKNIICFEVNDWYEYPKYFDEWFHSDKHAKTFLVDLDKYAKENKLCIKVQTIDMAANMTITAPREWVEKNCPELFEQYWEDRYVSKYPWPFMNDCKYHPDSGFALEDSPEEHLRERGRALYVLHQSYTKEEIENFKPHNLMGTYSGESFFDWKEENFGAIEIYEDFEEKTFTTWRVVDGKVIKEVVEIKE